MNKPNKNKTGEGEVNIKQSGKGFLIEIDDGITNPVMAVTKDELEKIVLYGRAILEHEKK